MEYFVKTFGLSLGLTLALEFPLAWAWGIRDWKTVLLANVMTNPLAVALHLWGIPQIPIEIGVVLAEWGVYRLRNFKRPLLLALTSNVFSYGMGLLIQLF